MKRTLEYISLIPGLCVDPANGDLHFYPSEFLRAHGIENTPANRELASVALRKIVAEANPRCEMIDLYRDDFPPD